MKLLADSFQRGFVVKDLIAWFKLYSQAFIQPAIINSPKQVKEESNVVEEKNEREIREALRKQRLLKLTNARHINPPVQVYRVAVYDMIVYSVIDDLSLKF